LPRRRAGSLAAPRRLRRGALPLSLHAASSEEVAERAGVSVSTLRRWVKEGLVPQAPESGGGWSPLAAAHVRLVGRPGARGHSIADIRAAIEDGRLAFGYIEDLLPATQHERSLKEAAKLTGLEPALIRRIYSNLGFTADTAERIGDEDLEMLQHVAEALRAGF